MKECWYISDNLSTSYTDVLDISTQERKILLECIRDKHEATAKAVEESSRKMKAKR